jgi:pSer/pThr/pTyr-binding forkhead associated (FHA) protein
VVISSSGAELEFGGKSQLLIGREDPISGVFPQIDMTSHGGVEGGVSRQHARISKQGAGWVIEDLNSTNYTFVNRQRLTPRQQHPLNDADEIRLGKVVLTFRAA